MRNDNGVALGQLADLLCVTSTNNRGWFYTAVQISEVMGCSKLSAYRYLKQLKEYGYKMETKIVREGVTGPKSVAYKIIKSP